MITLTIISAILAFVSGMSEGLNNTLLFRYSKFKLRFPKANEQYWNPFISWENKNNRGSWLFRNILSFLTDGFHVTKFIQYWGLIISAILIAFIHPLLIPTLWIAKTAGFHTTWTLYFDKLNK